MKNSDLLNLILSRVGKRQGSDYLKTVTVLELQVFLQQLESTREELPWFLEAIDSRTMVANQSYVDLPSDFLKEIEETGMIGEDPENGGKFYIQKRIPDVVNEAIAANPPGQPKYYAIFGNRWILGPSPIKAYKFSIPYGRKSTIFLDNDNEVSDWCLHATQGVSHSIQQILAAEHLQDAEMAAKYITVASSAWAQFKDYCNARKYTNLEIIAGDEE